MALHSKDDIAANTISNGPTPIAPLPIETDTTDGARVIRAVTATIPADNSVYHNFHDSSSRDDLPSNSTTTSLRRKRRQKRLLRLSTRKRPKPISRAVEQKETDEGTFNTNEPQYRALTIHTVSPQQLPEISLANILSPPIESTPMPQLPDLLPSVASLSSHHRVDKWTMEQVFDFIQSIPGCCQHAKAFLDEHIDGAALMLLTQRDIVKLMKIKLGPAIKIYNSLQFLKMSLNEDSLPGDP